MSPGVCAGADVIERLLACCGVIIIIHLAIPSKLAGERPAHLAVASAAAGAVAGRLGVTAVAAASYDAGAAAISEFTGCTDAC